MNIVTGKWSCWALCTGEAHKESSRKWHILVSVYFQRLALQLWSSVARADEEAASRCPFFLRSHTTIFLSLSRVGQRPVRRREMGCSVRLRSWLRRSSRRRDCGRARHRAEESSWAGRTRLQGVAVGATAPWCRQYILTYIYKNHIHTHTWKTPYQTLMADVLWRGLWRLWYSDYFPHQPLRCGVKQGCSWPAP
jgi:hypothetical protein